MHESCDGVAIECQGDTHCDMRFEADLRKFNVSTANRFTDSLCV